MAIRVTLSVDVVLTTMRREMGMRMTDVQLWRGGGGRRYSNNCIGDFVCCMDFYTVIRVG